LGGIFNPRNELAKICVFFDDQSSAIFVLFRNFMMKKNIYLTLFLLISMAGAAVAQTSYLNDAIVWKKLVRETDASGKINEYMSFDGAFSEMSTNLPLYSESIPLESQHSEIKCNFISAVFEPCLPDEIIYLYGLQFNEPSVKIKTSVAVKRKIPHGVISFIPIRLNPETGIFEKLVSFSMEISQNVMSQPSKSTERSYAENSVLSTGDWIKIKVNNSGIYKIGYTEIQSYGLNPATFDPRTIKIFGNAMGMLPEKNSIFRYDDLQENAIFVSGEDDGIFDEQDYILFYGMNPNTWDEVLGFFTYRINLYDDYNYYYLTTSQGTGKRVQLQPSSALTPTHIQTEYNDYQAIEHDEVNLILSGKKWYGDIFGEIITRDYNFNFPNLKANEEVIVKMEVANRTFINESMSVVVNNELFDTIILTSVNPSSTKYAQKKKKTIYYSGTGGQDIHVKLEYLPATTSSISWLDYIMVNAICNLKLYNGQFSFRDLSTVLDGAITKFIISDANPNVVVWDISNPLLPKRMESEYTINEVSFTLATDSLHEFIAFDGSMFLTPEFAEAVENQNLHNEGPFDLVIVTHPLFIEEANQLAAIHDSLDGFLIKVVTPGEIYNEFSSGKQDPSAIRDYIKMLYDRSESQEPRFLLLFGDGSFDPKDRLENNSNLIPTFQTEESWITASSYVIEDYFGYLDDNEGEDAIGELDIGIGRFPVQTKEEAGIIIDKIKRYLTTAEPFFGNWRNRICLIGDDEDGNLHLEQADSLSNGFIPKLYNQQKIYLDAYTQVKTPSGFRYPDVTIALNKAVNEGALIVNYVGHGGKAGWAHERILQSTDMLNWKNKDKLPVFITATCEFSRFDEPDLKTGGEMVLLNPEGGGIALFTTTRLAYSQSNFTLNQQVYSTAFTQINGEYPYLGDIIMRSKPPGQTTTRNFVLLGDPALKMAYPKYQVRTLSISNEQTESLTDTLHSLDLIHVSGDIADISGSTIENFNGFLQIELYDKKTRYKTIGNDTYSYPTEFFCQDKIIWQGKASVKAGKFEFTFLVPKDIAYNPGPGKISYYAWSDQADAAGYHNEIIIGGINPNAQTDLVGPNIDLFLNDLSFASGDQTHENPIMLGFLSDESGINLSAGGIGHEITAVLDDDNSNVISLNDYFVEDINNFRSGSITYPFYNLPDGTHTLTLKAWDNYNNSAEKTISFLISTHGPLELNQVINYPNPFKNSTTFSFNHTRPGDKLEISLEIFDLTGKIVLSYEETYVSELTNAPFLVWNGDDLKGNKLRSGIYLYTLQVTDEDGNTSVQQQKLVLMN